MDLFNVKKVKALESNLLQVVRQNVTMASRTFVNQNIAVYPRWEMFKQIERYATTDDIYSIIRLIATTSALVPLYAYQVTDEKSLKQISKKSYDPRSIIQTKQLQTKALTDLPENDKLVQILENPHLYMSKFEFFEAIYSLLMLQGECIIYKMRSEFGVNAGQPVKLEFLESHNVVRNIGGFPHQIVSYEYQENGITIIPNIPPEDIIHIRYFRGLSPLEALHKRLYRMDAELNVSVSQLNNGGVPGVLYDKSDNIETVPTSDGGFVSITEQRKQNFYNFLRNKANKGAPFMAAGDLGYISIGSTLVDLNVAELSKLDFKKLCNAFGVSDVLFNEGEASTESNVKVQEKRLYTNTCLPNVYRVRDALISGLIPEFSKASGKKLTIREDISEIPALQDDMLKMAQAFAAMPWFIPNEQREMIRLERDPDPAADKIYIKTGYVALEDLQGSQELPITEDYNKP